MAELINPPTTLVCLFSKKRAGGDSLREDTLGLMALCVRELHLLYLCYTVLCVNGILRAALRRKRGNSTTMRKGSDGLFYCCCCSPVLIFLTGII